MRADSPAALAAQREPLSGYARASEPRELVIEALLRAVPNAQTFSKHLLYLTEEPHQTGTPRNMELADYVRARFIEYGLEEVHFHDTPALMSYARSASAEIVEPVRLKLKLAEDPHPRDKDSYLYSEPGQIAFHAYANDGDVTADVVYANAGSPEDFAKLDALGIDVRGKLVLMRYSEPYSYRGYKVYLAESRGALGAIIYSDPEDDGYGRGEVYPDGPWGPASHIQWGAIVYDWFGSTPFTFHWKKQLSGRWREVGERDRRLPKIPSLPMSHEDAAEILSRLEGPAAPPDWQGGLPFAYHVGPGPVRVHLRVDNDEQIETMRNVIGQLRGAEQPERWVLIGNHRDAWSYGAFDPSSGTAALLEVARAFGAAAQDGHRPKRTVVFANWDAEEQLLGGSAAWALDNRKRLRENGVVYVNVDSSAAGGDFSPGAVPSLADFVRDVAKAIDDPDSGGSVYDASRARSETGELEVEKIVGATDYTAFLGNVGMSCIDMSFQGPYGVYHSQYDNYFWMSRIADPGFRYNTTMARLWSVLSWRIANAEVLPMRYSRYATEIGSYVAQMEERARSSAQRALDLSLAREGALRWKRSAEAFEAALAERLASDAPPSAKTAREVDTRLIAVERALTEESGLLRRPFFKHLIYAPQPSYREEVLPRIFEAIDDARWDAIPAYERELVAAFSRAAELLDEAAALLGAPAGANGASAKTLPGASRGVQR
ncbi:MAG TPA: M28 family peptidase [Myxococcota bacterium]|nr:M28 family peptidase [Myxococcota bacterium]